MKVWPMLRVVDASNLAAGSLVRWRDQPAFVAHDTRGKYNLLIVLDEQHFTTGPHELEDLDVVEYVGELVVDLTENDFSAPLARGGPNRDTEAAVFVAESGPMLAIAAREGPGYSMFDLESGHVIGRPDYAMRILPRWRIGVLGDGGPVSWLIRAPLPEQA